MTVPAPHLDCCASSVDSVLTCIGMSTSDTMIMNDTIHLPRSVVGLMSPYPAAKRTIHPVSGVREGAPTAMATQ